MENIYNIASKQFNGFILTSDEEQIINSWLAEEGNKDIYDDLHNVWMLTGKLEYSIKPNLDQEWESFKKINQKQNSVKRTKRLYIAISSAAASIILLIGIFSGVNYFNESKKEIYLASNTERIIHLPDNSQVWLNKNSKLSIARNYNKNSREVELDGEAYFDIQSNVNKPFIIKTTSDIYTKVLGTSFNLRAYSDEDIVELQVVSGKVQFGDEKENSTIVEKDHAIKFDLQAQKLFKPENIKPNLISWKTKEFNFDNSEISDVVLAFERYFNLTISIPRNSGTLRFSGDFDNPTTEDFAEVVGVAFNWDYNIQKEAIKFSKK